MFERFLLDFVEEGRLTLICADGRVLHGGRSAPGAPEVTVRLTGAWTAAKIACHPDLYAGEAYMDGTLVIESGTLWDLLDLYGRNLAHHRLGPQATLGRLVSSAARYVWEWNSRRRSQRNVAHHYDLPESLFRTFLDPDMQYSCAYFPAPGVPVAAAQVAKKRHIAAKLLLRAGQRVLDIGSGWGGLALSIAAVAEADVTGVTLSQEQLAVARRRAQEQGLDGRVRFEARDYRDLQGPYERIVSVGMFEHVGRPNYQAFFDKIRALLTGDGVALIHSIGRFDGPAITPAWMRKYIFPGGYIPALSEVLPAIEASGLFVTDIEVLRLHYAETLRAWRETFLARLPQIRATHDERFCRMWEFYLASSEMAFRYDGLMVFQIQLARRLGTVPLTRDYMVDAERAMARDAGRDMAAD